MSGEKRDFGLDFLKGICILLVVVGHLPHWGTLEDSFASLSAQLYTFHVPSFVFVSGFLFGHKTGTRNDFRGVALRLLRPYFAVSFLLGIGMRVIAKTGVSFNVSNGGDYSLSDLVYGIVIGHGSGATWFLYTLAICQFLFLSMLAVTKHIQNRIVSLMMAVVFVQIMGCLINCDACPITLQTWFASFFAMGILVRNLTDEFPASPLWGVAFLLVGVFVPHTCGCVGNVVWVVSFCGFIAWIGRVCSRSIIGKFLAYVGNRSLSVLLFHVVFISVLRRGGGVVCKIEPTGILALGLIAAISVAACLALDSLLARSKYMRWLI